MDNQTLEEIKIDNNLSSYSEVGVDIDARSELILVWSQSNVEVKQGLKWRLSWSRWYQAEVKVDIWTKEVQSKLLV